MRLRETLVLESLGSANQPRWSSLAIPEAGRVLESEPKLRGPGAVHLPNPSQHGSFVNWRCGDGHFDTFVLNIPDETTTTMLDVLLRIQREQDPTVAFRFACRVNMCGSSGMVINGMERLACKMNVSNIAPGRAEINSGCENRGDTS